eukprot:3398485-Rhodomonas_salina.2
MNGRDCRSLPAVVQPEYNPPPSPPGVPLLAAGRSRTDGPHRWAALSGFTGKQDDWGWVERGKGKQKNW